MAQPPRPAAQAAPRAVDDTRMPGGADHERSPISDTQTLLNAIFKLYNTLHNSNQAFKDVLRDCRAYHSAQQIPGPDNPGSAVMREPMHFNKGNYILCNAGLTSLVDEAVTAEFPSTHSAKKLLESVLSYWTSANSLKQLERFADMRQLVLQVVPLPDGSNFQRGAPLFALHYEYYLRRLWIRHLHFPGLRAANNGRELSLRYLYNCGRVLLEIERNTCPMDMFMLPDSYRLNYQRADQHLIGHWIGVSRTNIRHILEDVASLPYTQNTREILRQHMRAKLGQPANSQPSSLSRDDLFKENFAQYPTEILTAMVDRYNELMQTHPFERLMMDLLEKENTFEQALTVEHVEDKLINKQVTIFDERYMMNANQGNVTLDTFPSTMRSIDLKFIEGNFASRLMEKMRQLLADISHVNRQRRNFRLMREWIYMRPWKIMFQPHDTSGDNAWLVGFIKQFKGHDLHRYDLSGPFTQGEPSSVENTRHNMFGIKPIDATKDWQIPGKKRLFTPCTACSKAFEPGNDFDYTVMILHCRHTFHIKCIFNYWDEPNRYQHTCPECGVSPLMNHQMVGMAPGGNLPAFDTENPSFVHNLFGWDPPDPTGQDFDIPSGGTAAATAYWDKEMTYIRGYVEAPLKWNAAQATAFQPFSWRNPTELTKRIAQDATHRLMARFPERTGTGAKYFDSSRFDVDTEVGYLRHRRRARDRNRRKRMEGSGLGGDVRVEINGWSPAS